jgi:hypothetical protein
MRALRGGSIPSDERSQQGCDVGRLEAGVSCFEIDEARCAPGVIAFVSCLNASRYLDRDLYIVEGTEVGRGIDGEPLLRDITSVRPVWDGLRLFEIDATGFATEYGRCKRGGC